MNWLRHFIQEWKLTIIHIKQLMQFHWMYYFEDDACIFILSKNIPYRDYVLNTTKEFVFDLLSESPLVFNGKKYGKRPKRPGA